MKFRQKDHITPEHANECAHFVAEGISFPQKCRKKIKKTKKCSALSEAKPWNTNCPSDSDPAPGGTHPTIHGKGR